MAFLVRQSASLVRGYALRTLRSRVHEIRQGRARKIRIPEPGKDSSQKAASGSADSKKQNAFKFVYTREQYAKRLEEVCQEIENEKRGAFSHWIQDPTYLALFIPTGITGVIALIIQYCVSR